MFNRSNAWSFKMKILEFRCMSANLHKYVIKENTESFILIFDDLLVFSDLLSIKERIIMNMEITKKMF